MVGVIIGQRRVPALWFGCAAIFYSLYTIVAGWYVNYALCNQPYDSTNPVIYTAYYNILLKCKMSMRL